jgi:hypothetical protein
MARGGPRFVPPQKLQRPARGLMTCLLPSIPAFLSMSSRTSAAAVIAASPVLKPTLIVGC